MARKHKKSAVFLRRFCLARKIEQGNAIQLSVVLFLSAYNRCTDSCTAAGEQQGDPQSKVACIASLRTLIGCSRFGTGRFFLKSSNRIFDSLCILIRCDTRKAVCHDLCRRRDLLHLRGARYPGRCAAGANAVHSGRDRPECDHRNRRFFAAGSAGGGAARMMQTANTKKGSPKDE